MHAALHGVDSGYYMSAQMLDLGRLSQLHFASPVGYQRWTLLIYRGSDRDNCPKVLYQDLVDDIMF